MNSETKVGIMFLSAIAMVIAFAYVLGAFNPFTDANQLRLAYNFAGGIEVGSPVRVMGIKVGKVKSINFDPKLKAPNGEEAKLEIVITIDKSAWETVRADSKFYINLAGVIGEKFIEISPGSLSEPTFKNNQLVRGEDPPRVDQLISQSYGLAGKIMEFVESNEGSVIETIQMMNNLVLNLNKLLKQVDKTSKNKELRQILRNMTFITDDLVVVSDDVAFMTQKLRSKEGQKSMALLHKLLWRLEDLDKDAIKKFLQEEGIKAKLF